MGKFTLIDGKVPMRQAEGLPVQMLSVEDARDRLKIGWIPLSAKDAWEAENEKKKAEYYDNPTAAATLGLARSLTGSLSDYLVNPEIARNLRKYNPTSTTVGEVGGLMVPAGVTGKAMGAAGNIVKYAGESIGKKILAKGVNLAAEGAVLGLTQSSTEARLDEGKRTPAEAVEHTLSTVGTSALLNMGVGTLGVLGGKALGKVKEKLTKPIALEYKAAELANEKELQARAIRDEIKTKAETEGFLSPQDEYAKRLQLKEAKMARGKMHPQESQVIEELERQSDTYKAQIGQRKDLVKAIDEETRNLTLLEDKKAQELISKEREQLLSRIEAEKQKLAEQAGSHESQISELEDQLALRERLETDLGVKEYRYKKLNEKYLSYMKGKEGAKTEAKKFTDREIWRGAAPERIDKLAESLGVDVSHKDSMFKKWATLKNELLAKGKKSGAGKLSEKELSNWEKKQGLRFDKKAWINAQPAKKIKIEEMPLEERVLLGDLDAELPKIRQEIKELLPAKTLKAKIASLKKKSVSDSVVKKLEAKLDKLTPPKVKLDENDLAKLNELRSELSAIPSETKLARELEKTQGAIEKMNRQLSYGAKVKEIEEELAKHSGVKQAITDLQDELAGVKPGRIKGIIEQESEIAKALNKKAWIPDVLKQIASAGVGYQVRSSLWGAGGRISAAGKGAQGLSASLSSGAASVFGHLAQAKTAGILGEVMGSVGPTVKGTAWLWNKASEIGGPIGSAVRKKMIQIKASDWDHAEKVIRQGKEAFMTKASMSLIDQPTDAAKQALNAADAWFDITSGIVPIYKAFKAARDGEPLEVPVTPARKPTSSDLRRYSRAMTILSDPNVVIDMLKANDFTEEDREVLKRSNPDFFKALQSLTKQAVLDAIKDGKTYTREEERKVRIMLEQPFIDVNDLIAFQENFKPKKRQAPSRVSKTALKGLSDSLLTESQKMHG